MTFRERLLCLLTGLERLGWVSDCDVNTVCFPEHVSVTFRWEVPYAAEVVRRVLAPDIPWGTELVLGRR